MRLGRRHVDVPATRYSTVVKSECPGSALQHPPPSPSNCRHVPELRASGRGAEPRDGAGQQDRARERHDEIQLRHYIYPALDHAPGALRSPLLAPHLPRSAHPPARSTST
ncbi:hypothetical protein OH76DRAFT_1490694 [Lentinus brumalis]|uniref:Uncharacterized protein n=1 Tax=Lentinus brumalis TaxID=2498619 RepID=A0A371CI63_9APHY|nr:hypothetical protein OH76DRAFT_1490694 [Polyporus brumalis]